MGYNNTGTHEHWYKVTQVKSDFTPAVKTKEGVQLYERVEYTYSMCNCGLSLKSRITEIEA